MMRLRTSAAAALLAAFPILAARADMPRITADHGTVYQTRKAGLPTQGFVEIDNAASIPDILTGAECPIAGTTSIIGKNGAAIQQLQVAPGQHLIFTPNGPHILLQSTHFSIDQGGAIPCSLSFQNAGPILIYLYAIPAP